VSVQVELPPALKYLNSQPAAEIFGKNLRWGLGTLTPKQVVRIDVNCQAANAGEVALVVRGTSPDLAEVIGRATTRIIESALSVRFVDPPQAATVGQVVGFNFEVTNLGGSPLQSVVVKDTFDAGLQPNYPVDPNRPLTMDPFPLAAGETRQQSVSFIVRRTGQLCHTVEVSAEGGHSASARACIEVTQPVMGVDVRKSGPDQARVGERIPFTIVVTNTGDSVITNLRVADTPDPNLQPVEGSGELPEQGSSTFQVIRNSIVWSVPTLEPNRTVKLDLVCVGKSQATAAINTVHVTADGGLVQTATAQVAIDPVVNPAPAVPAPAQSAYPATPPRSIPSGELRAQVVPLQHGVRMGEIGTYFVYLRNYQNFEESDVMVSLQLPEGLEYVRHTWSSNLQLARNPSDPRTVEIGPIRFIGPRQTNLQPLKIELGGIKPGNYQVTVQARSRTRSQPVQVSTKTFVAQ
jgi:uncharacterized repeat protein (TIGR01451 family)